jgi:hypothetical protein
MIDTLTIALSSFFSTPKDVFDEEQDYIVFVFDNGGQHLEGAEMKSLKHAKV